MTTFLDKFHEVDEAIRLHEAEADKWFEIIAAERSEDLEGNLAAHTLEARESYQQYHVQASTDVLAGTGDWLLRDERLKTWGSSSSPSILWLRGPPGFGKTKLV